MLNSNSSIRELNSAELDQVGGGLLISGHAGKVGVKISQGVKPINTTAIVRRVTGLLGGVIRKA